MKLYKRSGGRILKSLKGLAVVTVSGILSLQLMGCSLLPKEEGYLHPPTVEPEKVAYETIEMKKGNIEKKLEVGGFFISTKLEPLMFKERGGILKVLKVQKGDKVEPGQLIAELESNNLDSEIKQQKINLRRSEIDYESAKQNPNVGTADLEKARLNVQSAKIRLEDLEREYSKCTLYSTTSGEVIYMENISPGGYINANKTIVSIADPNELLLQYKGDKASLFKAGAKVDVNVENMKYEGEVILCPSNLPKDADKELQGTVRIKVKGTTKEIDIGDAAVISLILEKKTDALVLPKKVVTTYNKRSFVQILKDGTKSERDVEIGVETDKEVEIVKGLTVGEQVIVPR
jgi:RND family efflux transporter MFP subunit